MFTGIIQEVGKIATVQQTKTGMKISMNSKKLYKKLKNGDSMAVNGVCLTVSGKKGKSLFFDVIHETIAKSNIGKLQKNSEVNLEPPLTAKDFLSGHIVLGHVDGTGLVKNIHPNSEIEIQFPKELKKFIAFKGCIAVNGVSLTIAKLTKNTFTVALTPFTLEETTFKKLKKNDSVNLEVDMMARYLENLKEQNYENE